MPAEPATLTDINRRIRATSTKAIAQCATAWGILGFAVTHGAVEHPIVGTPVIVYLMAALTTATAIAVLVRIGAAVMPYLQIELRDAATTVPFQPPAPRLVAEPVGAGRFGG